MITLSELMSWVGAAPAATRSEQAQLGAVLHDLFESRDGHGPAPDWLAAFATPTPALRLYGLRAAHLLWHPALRAISGRRSELERFFLTELPVLAAIAEPTTIDSDEDRREELIRRALRALGQRPGGESAHDHSDRLRQVDSVERRKVLLEAAEREKRTRQVREALAKKAAQEAAAKVSRE